VVRGLALLALALSVACAPEPRPAPPPVPRVHVENLGLDLVLPPGWKLVAGGDTSQEGERASVRTSVFVREADVLLSVAIETVQADFVSKVDRSSPDAEQLAAGREKVEAQRDHMTRQGALWEVDAGTVERLGSCPAVCFRRRYERGASSGRHATWIVFDRARRRTATSTLLTKMPDAAREADARAIVASIELEAK
jgi:hypothetical protein